MHPCESASKSGREPRGNNFDVLAFFERSDVRDLRTHIHDLIRSGCREKLDPGARELGFLRVTGCGCKAAILEAAAD